MCLLTILIVPSITSWLHNKHRCPDKIVATPPPSTWSSVCLDFSWCRTEKCKPCFLILHHVCLRPPAEHTLQPPIRPSPPEPPPCFKPALHCLAPDPHWPPGHRLALARCQPLGWSGGKRAKVGWAAGDGEAGGWLHCGNGGRKVLAVCSGLHRERRRRSGRLQYQTFNCVNTVKHVKHILCFNDWSGHYFHLPCRPFRGQYHLRWSPVPHLAHLESRTENQFLNFPICSLIIFRISYISKKNYGRGLFCSLICELLFVRRYHIRFYLSFWSWMLLFLAVFFQF